MANCRRNFDLVIYVWTIKLPDQLNNLNNYMAPSCVSFPLSKYSSFKISRNVGNYGGNYGNYGVSMLLYMAGVRVYNGFPQSNFCSLKVVFQSPCKLRSLFHFKDTLDKKIRSDLVYRYTCSNCNVTYYGKTYRHFFTRAAEHMGISNLTEKRVKNVKQSAVSDHLLQCDCSINFDDFDILASETNNFRLLIKESLLIMRDKPVLNRTTTSFPLKLFD